MALHAERAELVRRLALAALVHRDEHRIVRRVRVHRARPLGVVLAVALHARRGILEIGDRQLGPVATGGEQEDDADRLHMALPASAPFCTHWINAQRSSGVRGSPGGIW